MLCALFGHSLEVGECGSIVCSRCGITAFEPPECTQCAKLITALEQARTLAALKVVRGLVPNSQEEVPMVRSGDLYSYKMTELIEVLQDLDQPEENKGDEHTV